MAAVDNLQPGQLEDGTAIGTAIATAANRLRDAPGNSRVVVLLTDVTDTAVVPPVADRMLKLLTTPYNLHGHEAQTSASIGICFYPADGLDVTALMKNADIAMYHAKELHRNNYQFYAEEMNQRMIQRLQLERELRAGVALNSFCVSRRSS
jgi:predicted signal transduction protein with EAL and GGDEF domain